MEKPRAASRRSQRLKLQVPVEVHREATHHASGREHRERSTAMNLNAFGGLLMLRAPVQRGDLLFLTNRSTNEVQECRVVSVGPAGENGKKIGVEFTKPSAHFWGIYFPPTEPRANGR